MVKPSSPGDLSKIIASEIEPSQVRRRKLEAARVAMIDPHVRMEEKINKILEEKRNIE